LIDSGRRVPDFGVPCEKKIYRAMTRVADALQTKIRCMNASIMRAFALNRFARDVQLSPISWAFLQHCKCARIVFAHLQKRACTSRTIAFRPLPQGSARGRRTHFLKPKTVFFVVL
jgi:hypothetical protein